ncbi:MAG: D-2-hydroxyacid dehydrogenase [Ruminococcaceae bacterium]|nr:D-2-hydroxyacid dehydrogenase [Oscillospiraceae bacterium]
MNIVITDWKTVTNGDLTTAPIERFGNVTVYPLTAPEQIAGRIQDADIVLCNKTPMTAETLKNAKKLKYIGLFATGYNNIDLAYTNAHGITVCNAGGYSTDAVAQHVFAMILSFMSRVEDYRRFCDDGKWIGSDVFSPFCFPMQELSRKTLGIVGFGNIGKAVAKIALAFNMKVLCYTRTPRQAEGVEFVELEELLRRADIVSPHCPLNPDSAKLFNAATFAQMKQGALFINTSRGGVVDEEALREALVSGHLGGAALDVLETEPMKADCPLYGVENCLITPHVAWAPLQTRERLLALVCDNIAAFLEGDPQNVVK